MGCMECGQNGCQQEDVERLKQELYEVKQRLSRAEGILDHVITCDKHPVGAAVVRADAAEARAECERLRARVVDGEEAAVQLFRASERIDTLEAALRQIAEDCATFWIFDEVPNATCPRAFIAGLRGRIDAALGEGGAVKPRDLEHYTSPASACRLLREYADRIAGLTEVTVKVTLKIRIYTEGRGGITSMDIITHGDKGGG